MGHAFDSLTEMYLFLMCSIAWQHYCTFLLQNLQLGTKIVQCILKSLGSDKISFK